VEVSANGGAAVERRYVVANAGAGTVAEIVSTITVPPIPGLTVVAADGGTRVELEADTEIGLGNFTRSDYGYEVADIYSNAVAGNRRWTAYRTAHIRSAPADETSMYALHYTSYHGPPDATDHKSYTVQLMGWWLNRSRTKLGGTIAPHSHVALGRHSDGTDTTGIAKTAIHEVGHSLDTVGANDYHDNHSGSTGCVADGIGETASSGPDHFCPRHVRLLRNRVNRTWPSEGVGESGE
jgi:hypothetical protein